MSTDPKTIRSYNAYAKRWAHKMRSGENIAHSYLEKPAMYQKIPNIKEKNVLCIGCGTGEECDHLLRLGARRVVGIDISKELIKIAQQSFPNAEFHVMDMERLEFPANSFDFVYSSLTMHYLKNWIPALKRVYRVLKKDSTFLFSMPHPLKWSAETKRQKNKNIFTLGYVKYKNTDKYEIHGDYLNERKIKDLWFNEFPVMYYHKPISLIMKEILAAGFKIVDFLEPKPIPAVRKIKKNFWQIHQKIPLFMIFELRKK